MDSYMSFFKNETKDLRSLAERESVSLVEEMGDVFFKPQASLQLWMKIIKKIF